ncbi:glycosyltransferase family 4 protein [Candidatus Soleaferrea massiliensis]|uniref:glycosyltransferase family 4 protein n=1 Tax=Candidatus Soleaferrea massiliensis TaxID=1470354 RepID=UPI00058CF236|nr:glycosyltransferase family 4 protein [Candidatus Soleaferrea massiliensis]
MRVLLLSPLPPPAGGIATWTDHLMQSGLPDDVAWRLIDCAVRGKRSGKPSRRRLGEELRRAWRIRNELRHALDEEQADLIHLNTALSVGGMLRDSCLLQLARRRGVPVILHCHRNLPDAAAHRCARFLIRRLCGRSGRVICLNRPSRDYLQKVCGVTADILPNFLSGVEEPEPKPVPPNIRNAVFVGELSVQKGCDVILKAAQALPDITFRLVGRVKEDWLCESLPENIRLTGQKGWKGVQQELREADLFLFPSRSEGFPYAVLEAMANALPVIAADVGAIPEMLGRDGGILIRPGDTDGLIAAIGRLQDARLREMLGRRNAKKVRDCYTAESVLSRLSNIYQKVLEQHQEELT